MWTQTSSTCSFKNSFRIFFWFFWFFTFHVLLKLFLISNSPLIFGLNTTVLFHHIKIGIIIKIVYFGIRKCNFEIFTYEARDIFLLDRFSCNRYRWRLIKYSIFQLTDLLIDFYFILFHYVKHKSYLWWYLWKFMRSSVTVIIFLLFFLKI
jgi:hypothetical protein